MVHTSMEETVGLKIDGTPITSSDAEDVNREVRLYAGTNVVHGTAYALVTHTGMSTELGKIHAELESAEDEESPLSIKLNEFSDWLTYIIFAICIVVWLINIPHFAEHGGMMAGCVYYFKIAVALAVAAVPEGLPAVITTCLALGTKRMASRGAIVRHLPAVETLGCTTVICTDKTGTLTKNQMTVRSAAFLEPSYSSNGQAADLVGYELTKDGDLTLETEYKLVNQISSVNTSSDEPVFSRHFSSKCNKLPSGDCGCGNESGKSISTGSPKVPRHQLSMEGTHYTSYILSQILTLCNQSRMFTNPDGEIVKTGSGTELALREFASHLLSKNKIENNVNPTASADILTAFAPEVAVSTEFAFTRDRKRSSVVVSSNAHPEWTPRLLVKGAPEMLVERCTHYMDSDGVVHPLTEEYRAMIDGKLTDMNAAALRTIGAALKVIDSDLPDTSNAHSLSELCAIHDSIESNLVWVGMVGLRDPPRETVARSIRTALTAGIRIIMITGDNIRTAEAVAAEVGIHAPNASITGADFMRLPETSQLRILQSRCAVIARADPSVKTHIVNLLKANDDIVAMTGDGVNDAAALKAASVGIAMGSGVDVARQAADIVLVSDDFRNIVDAVEEGRSVYQNMKAFIRYLISSNIGEVMCIFFTAMLGLPESLKPIQLLWVNLVTDGPPATALGFNPPDVDVMQRPPRSSKDQLVDRGVVARWFVVGMYVGIATVAVFINAFIIDGVSFGQLTHYQRCGVNASTEPGMWSNSHFPEGFDCSVFHSDKPVTLSLTVLVMLEMFNAFNALSEFHSIIKLPPWTNPSLCAAVTVSVVIHVAILYIPFFNDIFGVVPISGKEWVLVMLWSFPVILVDELVKFVLRRDPMTLWWKVRQFFRSKSITELE